MSTSETSRVVKVTGKIGARFFIILTQEGTIKFYDWTTSAFTDGHSPKNNLTVNMTSEFFQSNIIFPTGGGTGGTYVLKLITLGETVTTNGSSVISKNIEKQNSDTVVTFKPASNVSSTKYDTLPSITAVGVGIATVSSPYSFVVSTANTDVGGFGLRSIFEDIDLIQLHSFLSKSDFVDTLFYHQTTKTISENLAGNLVSSTKIVLPDVTDLAIGTQVYYHKGTTAPTSTVKITNIDTGSKVVEFDNAVAFQNGETITFRTYTAKSIFRSIGLKISPSAIKIISSGKVTKTLRSDVSSSTTLELNNTLGIPGGNVIGISGVGVNNVSVNKVTSVNPDPTGGDGDGSIVVQVSQNLTQGTEIHFENTFTSFIFTGSITTSLFPSSNKEINIDLDKLLITGSAS